MALALFLYCQATIVVLLFPNVGSVVKYVKDVVTFSDFSVKKHLSELHS